MEAFRETVSHCGLLDLGLVGQKYTWCNGRFGDQRTLVRLDRMFANESWKEEYPNMIVYHVSMAAFDHCLLVLGLKGSKPPRKTSRRFFFEAMWTREAGCKEEIELAWDSYRDDSTLPIQERIKRCQQQLQGWN